MNERSYQRAKLNTEVVIRNGNFQEEGKAVNISLGGIFIRCQNPIQGYSDVELLINLPPTTKLWVKGKVRRIVSCVGEALPLGIGISFEELSDETKLKIEDYVRRTIRVLKALFYELNRAQLNEAKIKELLALSPIEYQYPFDILREKIASELSGLRLRPYNNS